ncbi:M48 family metalloprotease [Streptomyces sp. NPDC001843]|uniref:M48 family metalloprotease n=1 Tax=Streptomyces sp. NPDC001843 TaxID=3364617 RepID=UPI0036B59C0F
MSQPPDPSVPPQYPEPAYPDATAPQPPAYPAAPPTAPPSYPGEPAYPTAAPQYPHTAPGHPAAAPAYPAAAPTYPGQAPAYPAQPPASGAQAYPGQPPAYPAPPGHPTAGPGHPPTGGIPAPPATPPAAPPQYPAAYPPPPQTAAVPPQAPYAPGMPPPAPPSAPGFSPAFSPSPPPVPEPAPDDLDYRHRGARLHVAEHQRGADATAIGRLAVQLPGALVSLALVSSIALGIFGDVVGTIVILAWVASGLLVFHRPTELAFARYVLKLRIPTPEELARLQPIWNEVTARAGIEPGTYELMVENSDELNAVAVAGHVVGVTTYSLNRIPSSNLAAVLAHELGHHTGGHAWAGLLGYWYSLPGRIAWAATRGLARFAIAVASIFSMAATGFLILFMAMVAAAALFAAWYITIPLVVAPYLLAYAGRRGELRADQQAAELGFARQLSEVLYHFQNEETAAKAALAAQGQKLQEPGTLARLLSTHPDHQTRLTALHPYLGLAR